MNKTQLVDQLAESIGTTNAEAGRMIAAFTDLVTSALARGSPLLWPDSVYSRQKNVLLGKAATPSLASRYRYPPNAFPSSGQEANSWTPLRNRAFVLIQMRIVVAALLMVSVTAVADQNGFFFDTETATPRPRAHFKDTQRQRLLQVAHACNKSEKTLGEHRQCDELERQARQSIAERTRQFHEQAEPQRAELRALHRQQRGW